MPFKVSKGAKIRNQYNQVPHLTRLFSILIGDTLKGKNMLPMGSIFFPLIVAPRSAVSSQRMWAGHGKVERATGKA